MLSDVFHITRFNPPNEPANSRENQNSRNCLNNGELATESSCLAALGMEKNKWAGADLNRRHTDFQSVALPTELPALIHFTLHPNGQDGKKI